MPLARLFVDLNSFFASVEQQERPELRRRPVAVVPVETDSTCCIAASYEAKAFGVKTGTNVGEAKRMCPGIILVQGRHGLYTRYHHAIIEAAESVLPVESVHSIDEFSMRLMGAEREPRRAVELGNRIKHAIRERVGECMRCSIGIAPNRFLAKVASDMQKPDGLVVLEKQDLPDGLHHLALQDLPGIGRRMAARLEAGGITRVDQLTALSAEQTERLWGSVVGRWWHHWLRGEDWGEIPTMRRSIGHSHVLDPSLRNEEGARAVAIRLLHKAAARARQMGYWAQRLTLFVRHIGAPSFKEHAAFPETQDTLTLVRIFAGLWEMRRGGETGGRPLQVGVTLDDLVNRESATIGLFDQDARRERLAAAMDAINRRQGRDSVYFGATHHVRQSAPTRIAFNHIPDLSLPETSLTEDDDEQEERRGSG